MNAIVVIIFFYFNTREGLTNTTNEQKILNQTRRILRGNEVGDTRPYMVYLRPAHNTFSKESNWLCGGVIIHPRYILTSAACIEDVQQFYVISGTHRWLSHQYENDCIKNGAKKAVWKCVSKDYVFDGKAFDNIQWMKNDIAIVKVESDFNFERRIRGCDFIPALIAINNHSENLEASGTVASIAGWGSVDRFSDTIGRTAMNSPELLETDVVLMSKRNCKKRWPQRYHHIIDHHMICAKDGVDDMNRLCKEQELNCKELVYSDEDEELVTARRFVVEPDALEIHSANHFSDARRAKTSSGGFCENDHGGPLVYGHGKSSIIIGIISACMTTNVTKKCYGPFLYTSVWKNRHVISCAIDKENAATCRRLLQSGNKQIIETKYNWPSDVRTYKRESPKYSTKIKQTNKNETSRKSRHSSRKHKIEKGDNSTKIKQP